MKLSVLEGRFAVCRLDPTSHPPPWVFADSSSSFYSITKSAEELSIVCRQDLVPWSLDENKGENAGDDSMPNVKVERNWSLLMVRGPLEFSMTGILADLSTCLAEAGVSIFAVSTYYTDYLLVKCDDIDRAIEALTARGHEIDSEKKNDTKSVPRDGPALSFESDPLVATLVEGGYSCRFNLCVVTGWPPSVSLQDSYRWFCHAVQACWDDVDRYGLRPSVYVYPPEALHATAATLVRPNSSEPPIPHYQEDKILRVWGAVVRRATQDPNWPTEPLRLRIHSAQIGTRAGILIWKDETGGMERLRQCLKNSCQAEAALFEQEGVSSRTMDIPSIIHSTFLRFYGTPKTPGATVQQRFKEKILAELDEHFPDPIIVPIATFVWERTPYMHVPFDSIHVLASMFFTSQPSVERYTNDCDKALEQLQLLREDSC